MDTVEKSQPNEVHSKECPKGTEEQMACARPRRSLSQFMGCKRSVPIEFFKVMEQRRVREMEKIRLKSSFFSVQAKSFMDFVHCE